MAELAELRTRRFSLVLVDGVPMESIILRTECMAKGGGFRDSSEACVVIEKGFNGTVEMAFMLNPVVEH